MTLDQNSVNRLLSLNDAQLRRVLRNLAADYGVDLSAFALGKEELAALRTILAAAGPGDIEQLLQQFPGVAGQFQNRGQEG